MSSLTLRKALDGHTVCLVRDIDAAAVAWRDRWAQDPKDAPDLRRLLDTYHDEGNAGRVYDDPVRLERFDYDTSRVGMWLLGRDMALLADPSVRTQTLLILDDEKAMERLAVHMILGKDSAEDALEKAERSLNILREGFRSLP